MVSRRIGFRLALWHLAILLVSAFAALTAAYLLLDRSIEEQHQDAIEFRLQQFAAEYAQGGTDAVIDLAKSRRGRAQKAYFVRIQDPSGETVFLRDAQDWEEFTPHRIFARLAPGERKFVHVRSDDEELALSLYGLSDGRVLQVGRTTERRDQLLRRFWSTAGVLSILLVIAGVGGGAFLARRALSPIQRVTETVKGILITQQFSARVASPGTRDEIDELIGCLNAMLARIEVLIRGMGEALDNVAHDLRTPMTRLRHIAQSVLEGEPDLDRSREALADCLEESERVLTMLATLMDISEAQSGVMKLNRKPLDVRNLVVEVVDLYGDVAEEKGVSVNVVAGPGARVSGDPVRLRRAFANLVDNAIKYTPAGGRVTVGATAVDSEAEVVIADTGMGIPVEEQEKIWERLYRGDKSRSQRGLGLGLSFVKAIVEAHGGSVKVTSAPGDGARFIVRLPELEASDRAAAME